MPKRLPWALIALAGLALLAPGPVSRLILDVVGGLTLTILLLPFLVVGGGWLAWRLLLSRVRAALPAGCPACPPMSALPAAHRSGPGTVLAPLVRGSSPAPAAGDGLPASRSLAAL
ncbi:MAG: hypothetical protein DCF23_05455 [Cyanobium sp.]|nr:MAG: hypothetical protein DCF23_05455 [Cyanobium sp.]